MKKSSISVMALLAFIFAMGSAFTAKSRAEASAKQAVSYYWFNASGVYTMQNTQAAEQTRTGCSSTKALCENGYTGDEFNTPNDPHSGLLSGATPQKVIRKSTN